MVEVVRRLPVRPYARPFPCHNFTNEKGEKMLVTAIIVAISFYQDELGRDRIGYACSLGEKCNFPYCTYAYKK
jgi:hypothetical protein